MTQPTGVQLKDGDLLSNGDVAKQLGLSASMVTKLELQGRIRSIRTLGGYKIFLASDVEALAAERAKAKRVAERSR